MLAFAYSATVYHIQKLAASRQRQIPSLAFNFIRLHFSFVIFFLYIYVSLYYNKIPCFASFEAFRRTLTESLTSILYDFWPKLVCVKIRAWHYLIIFCLGNIICMWRCELNLLHLYHFLKLHNKTMILYSRHFVFLRDL